MPRRIAMTVTFLEMAGKPAALPPPSPRGRHAILRAEKPAPHFYRYLYDTIGDKYFWVDRRKISHDKLAEIIYLADLIATGRTCPIVGKLRLAVKGDLDQAMLLSLAFSVRYILKRGKEIHPQTVEAWNYFIGRGKSV